MPWAQIPFGIPVLCTLSVQAEHTVWSDILVKQARNGIHTKLNGGRARVEMSLGVSVEGSTRDRHAKRNKEASENVCL